MIIKVVIITSYLALVNLLTVWQWQVSVPLAGIWVLRLGRFSEALYGY